TMGRTGGARWCSYYAERLCSRAGDPQVNDGIPFRSRSFGGCTAPRMEPGAVADRMVRKCQGEDTPARIRVQEKKPKRVAFSLFRVARAVSRGLRGWVTGCPGSGMDDGFHFVGFRVIRRLPAVDETLHHRPRHDSRTPRVLREQH